MWVIGHLLMWWWLLMLHRLLKLRVKAEGEGLRLRLFPPVRPDAVEDDGEADVEDEEDIEDDKTYYNTPKNTW